MTFYRLISFRVRGSEANTFSDLDFILALIQIVNLGQIVSSFGDCVYVALWHVAFLQVNLLSQVTHLSSRQPAVFFQNK